MIAVSVVAGAVLAAGVVRVTRRRGAAAPRIFAAALVGAALLYVAFALVGRATPPWVALELLGLGLYGAAAWVGLRRWGPALAVGWAGHVAWDLALHRSGPGAAYTPAWYPWLCVGFDLILAVAVVLNRSAESARGALPNDEALQRT